jgi:hypothetical protein
MIGEGGPRAVRIASSPERLCAKAAVERHHFSPYRARPVGSAWRGAGRRMDRERMPAACEAATVRLVGRYFGAVIG